jgi:DNA-binding NarL/FixJ family response regulator
LKHWLANHSGVVRVEAYSTPEQGIQAEAAKTTDLWLVNRLLPANQSFEQWARRTPKLCSLCYSVHEDSNQLFLATPGGASAYLLKRIHPDRLLEPLTGSGAACSLSSPDILSRARKYFEAAIAAAGIGAAVGDLETLTPREQELLAWLSKGYLDKEIATLLGISTWTVRGHLKNIFEKLKVHTRTEAVVKFLHK